MRVIAMAACGLAAFGLLAGTAFAQRGPQTWTDPQGRLTFQTPNNVWFNSVQSNNDTGVYVLSATPTEECHVFSAARADTADRSVEAVRRAYSNPIGETGWQQMARGMAALNGASVTVSDASVDTSGFWPVQRATLTAGQLSVTAVFQGRPGMELRGYCHVAADLVAEEQPTVSAYLSILGSIATGRDAQWRADFEAAQAAAAAPAAPPTPPSN